MSNKLLIFYGADLSQYSKEILRKAIKDGFDLIALDSKASFIAEEMKLPYTMIDAWINEEKMMQAKKKASNYSLEWFFCGKELFTINGICWPLLDRHAMYWFWNSVCIADAFCVAVLEKGIKEIKLFQNFPLRPSVYIEANDVHGVYIQNTLKEKIKISILKLSPQRLVKIKFKIFYKKIRKYLKEYYLYVINKKNNTFGISKENINEINKKLLLVAHAFDLYRLEHHIKEIQKCFKNRIIVFVIDSEQKIIDEYSKKYSIPFYCINFNSKGYNNTYKRFVSAYKSVCNFNNDRFLKRVLESTKYHFLYFFIERWPCLNALFNVWYDILKYHKASALFISNVEVAESMVAAEAANKLNIPTFSLPHGVGITRKILMNTNKIFYNFNTDKEGYIRSGIHPNTLVGCNNLMSINEYPVSNFYDKKNHNSKQWKILVLTAITNHPGIFFPSIYPGAQIKALKIIEAPPKDIIDKISVFIKVHPGFPDLEIIKTASTNLTKSILPISMPLEQALQMCDLVIALNYSGVGIIHSVRNKKPIIHFLTDNTFGKVDPYEYADLYLNSGLLITNTDEFWPVIQRFFNDNLFAENLKNKAEVFYQENVNITGLKTFGEVIKELIN
ncbi:MAG: hypothetical protein ACD_79C00090G0011 [uncultured bacterium]|nr:MAG: hypothetical protein ACD_79C00090G0011 [uncultured bacterium]